MPIEMILIIGLAAVVVLLFITFISRYKRCPSNRILVIYGKTGTGTAAKCIHGGAAFVIPLLQDYAYLDLEPFVVPIDLDNALSQENIRVSVPTTVTAAISNQPGIMQNAAVRLLGLSRQQVQSQAQDIILGQMRAVIATMQIEEINRDRQGFMSKVNEAVSTEMEKIGLTVINVNIKDIDDESGYITAIGRKAAAEAVNQAAIDVAEQEKMGKVGVAERDRDRRKAVAAAEASADIGESEAERERRRQVAALNSEAEIGESEAEREKRRQVAALNAEAEIGEAEAGRDKRQRVASLEAEAVQTESEADAKKAGYLANQRVAEESARRKSEEASKAADGAIRVAQENAQKEAEEARALREEARLKAEVVVQAEAEKQRQIVEAEGEKEQRRLVAEGEAAAILAQKEAEAKGTQAILDAKAEGYRKMVEACDHNDQAAAAFLIIERLTEVAHIQAEAIRNLPIEKIMVWDSGNGESGMSNLGQRLMGAIPPMHDLARLAGLELPEFLGRLTQKEDGATGNNRTGEKTETQVENQDAAQDQTGETTKTGGEA
ncbi:MAG: SPFH domain-containing protein [bacterium]|nr:SPFH domain-containing protein [bacterium]